jgi:hypothetical protein
MFELLVPFIAATSPFSGLITTLQNILLPVIAFAVGGLAIMRGIKGRFMDMIILLVIAFVALIFFMNPDILINLAGSTGSQISGGVN